MSTIRVDLNADVGESFGVWSLGEDAALIPHVTSANVACGFHAGDPSVMRETVAMAREYGVAVGAHPGLPDLQGFGRRELQMTPREVEDLTVYQIGALAGVAAAQGVQLQHVKVHGALYHMVARVALLADAIVRATASVDRSLVIFGPHGSLLIEAASRAGLRTASEVFADRAYRADGSLVPRSQPGAVIHDSGEVVRRVVAMVRDRAVAAIDGALVPLSVGTICVHGDTPGAAERARGLRAALEEAGIGVRAVGR